MEEAHLQGRDNIKANGAYPDWKDRKKKKFSYTEHKLKQAGELECYFWSFNEFLAKRRKKQMFILFSSSAFIYIYLPFR